jgi:hypothetical protein
VSKDSDDDGEVGYRKPPRSGQFKKGQSGCPSGGHAQRRANKGARARKAAAAERSRNRALQDIIRTVAREEQVVNTTAGPVNMPNVEIIVRKVFQQAMAKDASDKRFRQALALLDKAGLLKPLPEKGNTGVLVVYPIMKQDDWLKATEGERLPRDPLHGIPGAEGLLLEQGQPPRKGPPE